MRSGLSQIVACDVRELLQFFVGSHQLFGPFQDARFQAGVEPSHLLLGALQLFRLLSQGVCLLAQFGVAAAQLDKYRDLRSQDLRHDGLEKEIHCAQIVPAEEMLFVAIAGEKQDGNLARSRPPRISSAVSKPSISGMRTSSRIAAKSSLSR